MTEKEKELIRIVKSNINQSQENDLDKETNKFDFKTKWYNLKEPASINEFLKDTTAIVNTIGPTGYIVIGYDEKTKKVNNSKFKDCGLKDVSQILGLISKRVDRAFDIDIHDILVDGNSFSVIEIPPSIDKPHIIRQYVSKSEKEERHVIFVKSASGTTIANKNHLDRMYYDRKNIKPDYQVHIILTRYGFSSRINNNKSQMEFSETVYIENTGLRPICIKEFLLEFHHNKKIQQFKCEGEYTRTGMVSNIVSDHLIIQSDKVDKFLLKFQAKPTQELINKNNKFIEADAIKGIIKLNNGKTIIINIDNHK